MKIAYPLIVLALTACAGADVRPVVDMQGVNSTKYEADLRDCQEYAKQKGGTLETGAKGAVGGAAVGGLIGLVGGGTGSNISQAAGVGAVVGAAGGGYMGNKAQEDIVKKCLSGRGYKVLD